MDPGLCGGCRHSRVLRGARSEFRLCERSRDDPRYARYPRLPVRSCAGWEPALSWEMVREAVEAEAEAGLADLLAALRVAGVSARAERLEESAELLVRLLRADGWRAEVMRVEDNPLVLAEVGPAGAEGGLLLYGHHDVQPAEPLEAWTAPPFEPALREGRLWGRGTADDKGQLFCHLFAVRGLRRALGGVPARVRLVVDGQEEVGSPHIAAFVERAFERLRGAELLVTADGPNRVEGRPEVVFGVRGLLKLRLSLRTGERELHSGQWATLRPNAALRLAHVLAGLLDREGRVLAPGFEAGAGPPGDADQAALAALPEPLRSAAAAALRPALNVAGIASGWTGPGFKTVLPARAVAHLDARLVAGQDPDRVLAALRACVAGIEPEALLEELGRYPASRTPLDSPPAGLVVAAARRGFGADPLLVPCASGSNPEGVLAAALGMPAFHLPYGHPDQRNHGPDENLRWDHVLAGARTTAALVLELAGGVA